MAQGKIPIMLLLTPYDMQTLESQSSDFWNGQCFYVDILDAAISHQDRKEDSYSIFQIRKDTIEVSSRGVPVLRAAFGLPAPSICSQVKKLP